MKQLRGYGGNNDGNEGNNAEKLYAEAMSKFGGMSEDMLVNRLIEIVREQKSNGTFDEVKLLGFVNTVTPHLNAEQRKKLESVLGMID